MLLKKQDYNLYLTSICMCNELIITNRLLCKENFLVHLEKLCKGKPYGIVLREKDLREVSYEELAKEALSLCSFYDVSCILHTFCDVAKRLSCKKIHLSFGHFKNLTREEKNYFTTIGVSCHTLEEILFVEQQGATYATISPVFKTTCKPYAVPLGLEFLENVCKKIQLPLFALGGIGDTNKSAVLKTGVFGIARMSYWMRNEP